MPRRASLSGYCAMVRTPLRSPTSDAAVPPAFATPPLPLASWHSFLLAPQASVPISADHCLLQKAPECSAAPCTIIVRRYRSPSLLIFFCGSLSPEFLRPGFNPRKQPTSRLFRNRCGSSIVRTYVSAICVPTPFTCLSKDTSGYTSLAIFSIRSSYSWTPLVQRFDFFEQRLQNIPQLGAQFGSQFTAHLLCATLGQPFTIRLHQPACCVHQGRSSTHQFSSRPDYCQMDLRLRTAMPHRPQ
jgi:hypothetical protein